MNSTEHLMNYKKLIEKALLQPDLFDKSTAAREEMRAVVSH